MKLKIFQKLRNFLKWALWIRPLDHKNPDLYYFKIKFLELCKTQKIFVIGWWKTFCWVFNLGMFLFCEGFLLVTFQDQFRVILIFLITKKILQTKVISYLLNLNMLLGLFFIQIILSYSVSYLKIVQCFAFKGIFNYFPSVKNSWNLIYQVGNNRFVKCRFS